MNEFTRVSSRFWAFTAQRVFWSHGTETEKPASMNRFDGTSS